MSSLTALPKGSLILVTGANGYVGSHLIKTLLGLGFRVRGTVRSQKPWLSELFDKEFGEGVFEQVIVTQLDNEEALSKAMEGVSGVVHVASDVSFGSDPKPVISWVIKATETALAAAAKHSSIKRVVLTSSAFAAALPGAHKATVTIDENTWNEDAIKLAWDPKTPAQIRPAAIYAASKAEGERAAWKWIEGNKPSFEFNTVLPNLNTGEILHPEIGGSTMNMVRELLKGNGESLKPVMPQYYVDVGDVARLHAIALLAEPVKSQRIWASAAPVNNSDFIDVLRELRPDNKLIPEKPVDEGRDESQLLPATTAKKLLQEYFGQGWVSLKDSVAAGIRDL